MAEITQVKDNSYMVHYRSGHTEQYQLHGKQTAIDDRIYHIRRLTSAKNLAETCRYKAAFKKEESRGQAVKAVILFLMTNPPQFKNKTALISALKLFADTHKIKVSARKLTEQYPQIKGLVK